MCDEIRFVTELTGENVGDFELRGECNWVFENSIFERRAGSVVLGEEVRRKFIVCLFRRVQVEIFKPSCDPFVGVLGRVQHLSAGGQWIEVLTRYHVCRRGKHLLRCLLCLLLCLLLRGSQL